jgi:4-hydroxythreonine-4-phosphate dehydrogenase
MSAPSPPRIVLTMGDPAGVGPELALRALGDAGVRDGCLPIVFGDAAVLRRCAAVTGLPWPDDIELRSASADPLSAPITRPTLVDFASIDAATIVPGQCTAATGLASYGYIQAAIDAALARRIDGVTTGPINKEALHAAGINFPGHTEMFTARTDAARSCMMQYAPEITCTFVTVHVGYAEVPRLLTVSRIVDVIELTAEALLKLGHAAPRLVVCGLNPHAGEHGLFGDREEERIILPAIEEARRRGHDVTGPLPPDTAFIPSRRASTDAVICMYHDQGHIPVKALAFDSAVNTTLGLPVIRTSVDHGTAGDIAWQGVARPHSLFAALRLAAKLSRSN